MNGKNNYSIPATSNNNNNSGNIPKIILDKLQSSSRQNFTTILNGPPEPVITKLTI